MFSSRILLPLSALVLTSCASIGSRNKGSSSDLESASGSQAAAPEINLAGPTELLGSTFNFTQSAGRSFKIEVDKRTIRACYAGIGYKVTKVSSSEYVVEVSSLAVPAIVCSPAMQRNITLGKTLAIPASSSPSRVRVHVFGNYHNVQNVTVEARAATGVEVTKRRDAQKFMDYTFMQFQGKSITVDVDKKTIRACFPRVGYRPTKLVDTPSDYLIEVSHLMVPAVMCSPSMQRDIEIGFAFDATSTDSSLTWGRAIIFGNASFGIKAKAQLKTDGDSSASALTSDQDIKIMSAAAWRNDMPVVGPSPGDRTYVVIKIEANSTGCTEPEHFTASVVQTAEDQHIVIKRNQPDICEATLHQKALELTIRQAGYKLGKRVKFNNQPLTVSESIAH